jgi:RNase P/RNase MRP subunit p29
MLRVLQTSSQTCQGIQDRVVQQKHIKLVVQLGRSEHKSFL